MLTVLTWAMHLRELPSPARFWHPQVSGCVSKHCAVLLMPPTCTSAEMAAHAMADQVLFIFLIRFFWHSAQLQSTAGAGDVTLLRSMWPASEHTSTLLQTQSLGSDDSANQ